MQVRWKLMRPWFFAEGGDGGDGGGGDGGNDGGGGGQSGGGNAGDGGRDGAAGAGGAAAANLLQGAAARAGANGTGDTGDAGGGGDAGGEGGGDGGGGDARPEHIPEQFWRDGALDEVGLTKSWKDQQAHIKKLNDQAGLKPPTSADEYKVTLENSPIKDDDELLGAFRSIAHEAGLSQPMFEKLVNPFVEKLAELAPTEKTEDEVAAETAAMYKELGGKEKAEQLADVNYGFYKGLVDKKMLPESVFDAWTNEFGVTPDQLRFLDTMRILTGEKEIPDSGHRAGAVMTHDELVALQGSEAYQKGDPATLRKVEEGYAQLYGTDPASSGPRGGLPQPTPQHLQEMHKRQ